MKLFGYLAYLPLLLRLVEFIRRAEAMFRSQGTGAEKLKWVTDQLLDLVAQFVAVGLISPALAEAITTGAGTIISLIVQLMNAVHGSVPPAEERVPATLTVPPVSKGTYETWLAAPPNPANYQNGDHVYLSDSGDRWIVYAARFAVVGVPGQHHVYDITK